DGVVAALRTDLGPTWEISVILHSEKADPCRLYAELADADMLLTPHGFQSMLLLFLPPGAALFEIFPYKYWKEGYKPLALEWGASYEYIMSRSVTGYRGMVLFFVPQEVCMRSIHCRKFSRADDVRLEPGHLQKVVQVARRAAKERKPYLDL
ncbi:unnamed protein product, partial [Phaeothamnion confervicola]